MSADLPVGAVLASALMAANYGGDSGEDVDRLIAELAKRGLAVAPIAPGARAADVWDEWKAVEDELVECRRREYDAPSWERYIGGVIKRLWDARPSEREFRFVTWDDTTLVITVDEVDPGDMGEPRMLTDFDNKTSHVSVRAVSR